MEREALKLALEALESSNKLINGQGTKFGLEGAMDGYYSGCFDVDGNNKLLNKAITAIKEALAQPAQEPDALTIAYQSGFYDGKKDARARCIEHKPNPKTWPHLMTYAPLPVQPQRPWVELTEEDFSAINQSCLTKLQAATSAESILKKKNL
jgi:hypothetical protein